MIFSSPSILIMRSTSKNGYRCGNTFNIARCPSLVPSTCPLSWAARRKRALAALSPSPSLAPSSRRIAGMSGPNGDDMRRQRAADNTISPSTSRILCRTNSSRNRNGSVARMLSLRINTAFSRLPPLINPWSMRCWISSYSANVRAGEICDSNVPARWRDSEIAHPARACRNESCN